jgi:hypothetical protein
MPKKSKNMFEAKCKPIGPCGGTGGAIYGLGLVGAAFYYLQHATSLTEGFVGLLKALVWPAFLIYQAMSSLAM